jgi:hypothetical protein
VSEGEYLYGWGEMAEEDSDNRHFDRIQSAGGQRALAAEMNGRFIARYPTCKVRRGRTAKRCECCGKTIPSGQRRYDWAGATGRLYWHETCLPPHWFLRGFGWD